MQYLVEFTVNDEKPSVVSPVLMSDVDVSQNIHVDDFVTAVCK